jgi:sensor histidine kinase YesM
MKNRVKPWMKPTRLQWFSFFASMPFIDVLANYIIFKDRTFQDIHVWLISFPVIYFGGMGIWRCQVMIGNYVKYRFPALKQTTKRVVINTFLIVPFMASGVSFIYFFYAQFNILGYQSNSEDLKLCLLLGFCVNLVFETLYESAFVMEKYKETVKEKEQLEQQSVYTEFDSLKNQVNPHFLFNCFNTLSSLITEDKKKAEKFLDELSKVYRYLLRNNENGLSTVENEIKFIQSYYQLLQTRHGEAVQINIEIDKRYEPYLLPSLTLQLLVENVVKHNVLSKNKPLVIDIFSTAGNKLVVNNNLQRRSQKVPSGKVGLENIKAKYKLLKQKGMQVIEDGKNFTVVLPLIWNNNIRSGTFDKPMVNIN